jgi:ABC-type multidrug transport system ATPase subunit
MMKISLLDAGKRFNREWIFRHFNYQFLPSSSYAITGANGSGKSTLLQVIAGSTLHSEGNVMYERTIDHRPPTIDESRPRATDYGPQFKTIISEPYKYISFAGPYLELIEEMTAMEFLSFHNKFKQLTENIPFILNFTGLKSAADKQIRYFSSGMKQRLKLAQAFFSDSKVLLLDEPTTNLDAEGIVLYHDLIRDYAGDRIVIVSSNDEDEYGFCTEVIRIGDYK